MQETVEKPHIPKKTQDCANDRFSENKMKIAPKNMQKSIAKVYENSYNILCTIASHIVPTPVRTDGR